MLWQVSDMPELSCLHWHHGMSDGPGHLSPANTRGRDTWPMCPDEP